MVDMTKVIDLLGPSTLAEKLPGVAVDPAAPVDSGDWKAAWAAENAPKPLPAVPDALLVDPFVDKLNKWVDSQTQR